MDEICIVQISDTQVRMPNQLLKNNFDGNHALERAFEITSLENYAIDCLLITGDLVRMD